MIGIAYQPTMANITITRKEYKALESKSKAGWKFYYTLLQNDFEDALTSIQTLETTIKTLSTKETLVVENLQRLLDGHKLRVQCCICLEEDLNKENGQLLTCLHRFHKDCLKSYRDQSRNFKCPQCRQ